MRVQTTGALTKHPCLRIDFGASCAPRSALPSAGLGVWFSCFLYFEVVDVPSLGLYGTSTSNRLFVLILFYFHLHTVQGCASGVGPSSLEGLPGDVPLPPILDAHLSFSLFYLRDATRRGHVTRRNCYQILSVSPKPVPSRCPLFGSGAYYFLLLTVTFPK